MSTVRRAAAPADDDVKAPAAEAYNLPKIMLETSLVWHRVRKAHLTGLGDRPDRHDLPAACLGGNAGLANGALSDGGHFVNDRIMQF